VSLEKPESNDEKRVSEIASDEDGSSGVGSSE